MSNKPGFGSVMGFKKPGIPSVGSTLGFRPTGASRLSNQMMQSKLSSKMSSSHVSQGSGGNTSGFSGKNAQAYLDKQVKKIQMAFDNKLEDLKPFVFKESCTFVLDNNE